MAPARLPPPRQYPHDPQRRWQEAIAVLAKLAREHKVELIAIGNGTASRETDRLAADLIRQHAELSLTKVVVSEAGASVYSAPRMRLRNCPTSMSRCVVRYRSRVGCRTRSPSW